jgi:membrane protein
VLGDRLFLDLREREFVGRPLTPRLNDRNARFAPCLTSTDARSECTPRQHRATRPPRGSLFHFIPTVPKRLELGYSGVVRDLKTLKPGRMPTFSNRFYRAVRRVLPICITQTQAIAFNMFLAFFPMLLVVLGVVASSTELQQALQGMIARLRPVLPPGTMTILNAFLARYSSHPWEWVLLGLGGTLVAGTQMMKLMMDGFRMVHNDRKRANFVSRHVRALLLLIATIVPSIVIVILIVFGKQVRAWMLHISSMPVLIRLVWSGLYVVASLIIAMIVVSIIYRVGRPRVQRWKSVVPGAAVATVLWWIVSICLGFYLRHVPYSLVYGGLAVAIGLLLWMQFTATILLIGDAYNAELQQPANELPVLIRSRIGL